MISINRSLRNKVTLVSEDGKYTYGLFLRQSEEFWEDFSVGLIWTNAEKHINISRDIILIRFQGPHDSGKPMGEDVHHDYHIHQISVKDIEQRRYLRPGSKGITNSFSSFAGALFEMISYCHISQLEQCIDFSQFRPASGQISIL